MIWKLAWRNIFRNKIRSGLTLVGIAAGLVIMLFAVSLNNGSYENMIKGAISASAGHLVVQHRDYLDDPKAKQVVLNSGKVVEDMKALYPEGDVVKRIYVGGMLTSPRSAQAVMLRGVQPEIDGKFDRVTDVIEEGAWLDADGTDVGDGLAPDRQIVIGVEAARILGVELGDRVVFMGQTDVSDVSSRMLRVHGIFKTGVAQLDAGLAYITMDAAQDLFIESEDPATQVALIIPNAADQVLDTKPMTERITQDEIVVLDWEKALPSVKSQIDVDRLSNRMIYGLMALVIMFGVANAMTMSVMERIREFGVLRSVGMQPVSILGMVAVEATFLGALGALTGLAGAAAVSSAVNASGGIDFSGVMENVGGYAMDPIIHVINIPGEFLAYGTLAVIVTVISSLLPAWRAARLQPVEAMRHV